MSSHTRHFEIASLNMYYTLQDFFYLHEQYHIFGIISKKDCLNWLLSPSCLLKYISNKTLGMVGND